jgi:glycosyltransferase involved in cell wall biosynthesis
LASWRTTAGDAPAAKVHQAAGLKDSISVCICTYRRMHLLPRLFDRLAVQKTGGEFDFSVVVVDNDSGATAREAVLQGAGSSGLQVVYDVEPERNFALVRNRAVRSAAGNYIAFIDDDEVPVEDWLYRMRLTARQYHADGALGPVKPRFDATPPDWLAKSGLCERPGHPTGMQMKWGQTRSGNALVHRSVFDQKGIWFDPRYAAGGEDKDFFKRAMNAGCRFVWCQEAAAYELVPPERQTKVYHLKRALLQGAISAKYDRESGRRLGNLGLGIKTATAATVYTLLLPAFLLGGMHVFMKYLVKDCHHVSRLAAMMGRPLVKDREF